MKLQELYHLIGLQDEIIQKLRVICVEIHLGQMDEYLDKLMDGKTAAQSYEELKTVLDEDEDNLKMLYCQLECARRVFDRYQKKHILQLSNTKYFHTKLTVSPPSPVKKHSPVFSFTLFNKSSKTFHGFHINHFRYMFFLQYVL